MVLDILVVPKKFVWFVADENGIFYQREKAEKQKQEKEKQKALFLVLLLEKYGFDESDVRLDFELSQPDIFNSIDLLAFKNDQPYLAIDFLPKAAPKVAQEQARENLLKKAKAIKAKKAGLIVGKTQLFYNV